MILLDENSNYKELLNREGIKSTRHRNAILQLLEESESPLTAEQLFITLRDKSASIDLSTVYRTLDTFASKNLVIKSNRVDDGKALYELNHHEHKHHLLCVGCHKLISLEDCPMGELQQVLKKKIDFDVTGHKLEIYGYCHDCKRL
ncbi:Fur family transcriptional regulator [Desulfosporosinus sp. BICA1-9]|uniref:Fur family transcriptional regulator n=1 Tax=Desulfosporosinus sp. BICA1-9 TaxID=1531958 RepID=UPI00054B2ED1|nr:transcriptional repressor [Desulfosporosinus sp. BICA1-9]KJS47038.1 MAG: Fur family transcriptional regulator [Peptococcaceae bacterium BRH_c23]KJS86449.1 MAG: Fur family transcriptional regulator [Desulfosporosinus sp. BICA1-9]HBW35682.1 transcriptional repressor [Desulfosporosinus sp.]